MGELAKSTLGRGVGKAKALRWKELSAAEEWLETPRENMEMS